MFIYKARFIRGVPVAGGGGGGTATFVAAATDTASSNSDLTLTPTLSPTAGNLLVAFGFCSSSRTMTPPTGFTSAVTKSSDTYTGTVWTKTAAGSDNLDFTLSGGFGVPSVAVIEISTATATGILTASASINSSDNAPACPTVTTTVDKCLILSLCGTNIGGSATCTGPTERFDITGGSFGSAIAGYSEIKTPAGATGGRTIASSTFGHWVALTVAIPPV